ncbi:unnamed protein product [Caretta caretta]
MPLLKRSEFNTDVCAMQYLCYAGWEPFDKSQNSGDLMIGEMQIPQDGDSEPLPFNPPVYKRKIFAWYENETGFCSTRLVTELHVGLH